MGSNSLAIARCFDQAVNTYDKHAHIQQRACHHLLHLLANHKANDIIDLGCGTGFSTRALRQRFPVSSLYAIDISERCLQQAKKLDIHTHYEHSDFNNPESYTHQYQLIFANMSLQWATNLSETLKLLSNKLSKDGIVAFSLPLQGTFNNLKPCDIHQLNSNNDVQLALSDNNLFCIEHRLTSWHQSYRSALHALRAIKATGANYTTNKSMSRTCRQWLRTQLTGQQVNPFDLHYRLGFYIARSQ